MTKKIAVIDGNSLMHRAYHAINTPMTALDGTPTNAVFGFLQMFCKFIEETNPDAVFCAFDEGKPHKRIEELPEYKANRPHMDDELRLQFPVIKELLSAMNVPVITAPGWEGDDVLGTIAARDEKLGMQTFLVTGDKDACQLATDLTCIVNTKKGISDVLILNPEGVMEKYGVTPEQFIDYLGLMGDTSDNIPGVPGIGPKSAQTLLEKYGSIEGIYENIDDLKGKQRERLEENRDMAFLSRQIATIKTDLDFELDIEGAHFPSFEVENVETAFKKYSLMTPLTRVLSLVDAAPAVNNYDLGQDTEVDAKTGQKTLSKLNNEDLIGIAFMRGTQDTIFGASVHAVISVNDICFELEDDDAKNFIAKQLLNHNAVFLNVKEAVQLIFPANNDEAALIELRELNDCCAFDASLAAYLLDSTVSSYSYEQLCSRYLNGELPSDDTHGDVEILKQGARLLRTVAPILKDCLEKNSDTSIYSNIDYPLISVLAKMERTGVEINHKQLKVLGKESGDELSQLASKIYDLAGEEFNIDSPKQLGHILFEVLGLPALKKNKSGGYSTDVNVLRELSKTSEIAELVMRYREYSKIKSTYIDSLPLMRQSDGRIHTSFNQTVTATGRLSSSDPNLQNIPVRTDFGRRIRECFIPLDKQSVFMSADYSQIELRLLAHLSGDAGLIDAFREGADFHTMTAASIFGVSPDNVEPSQRARAKAVNFGIVYGQQAYGLSQALDISRAEAKEIIDAYYKAYPRVREYLDEIVDIARKEGYVETIYGRKRYIPEFKSSNKQVQGLGERTAMNHPMQGSAADIIKLAMIEVQQMIEEKELQTKLLLQVHDELDLSVPKHEIDVMSKLIANVMEGVIELKVPLVVDVNWGENWAKSH